MKNKLSTFVAVALAGLALAGAGCKKDKKKEPVAGSDMASGSAMGSGSAGSSMAGSGSAMGSDMAGSGSAMAGSGSATAPTSDTADKLEIFAKHIDPKKDDVTVTFTGIKVVEAAFDPEKIEGGTATIEVAVASLGTGIVKRDDHLKTKDYLEVDTFPTVTIKVDNVKKTGDNAYSADATVKAHGVEKKLPVTFTVAEKTADSVRINGEAKFSRLDFKVGKPEAEETTKADMTAKLQVTLKKS
jgi:polyisoprenoid-binding protein YceI